MRDLFTFTFTLRRVEIPKNAATDCDLRERTAKSASMSSHILYLLLFVNSLRLSSSELADIWVVLEDFDTELADILMIFVNNLNSSSIEAAALLYSSFILDEPSFAPYSGYVHDDSRFVWNYLADRTSIPKENTSSVCSQNCDDKSEVCITVETGKGTCIISTTSLPGYDFRNYSTRLEVPSSVPRHEEPCRFYDPDERHIWNHYQGSR
ncbi:Nicastrin, partial [Cucurbita argyrosperma subsp. argyrosperma]